MKSLRARFLAPEIIQTSAMDCGPACLKALLDGHGISVSYDRLREACQTDLDGTSINTIEQLARELGLDAEQIMLPVDHLLRSEARVFPALVVVRLPNSLNHFTIAWRKYGRFVQVMDPACGRRWMKESEFLSQVMIHPQPVPASGWRKWAGSDEFLGTLHGRAKQIGLHGAVFTRIVQAALNDSNWRSIAFLDASIRMLTPIAASGRHDKSALEGLLEQFFSRASETPRGAFRVVPPAYWCVLPAKSGPEHDEQLVFRGAVALRVRGCKADLRQTGHSNPLDSSVSSGASQQMLRPPIQPLRELFRILRADGALAPTAMVCSLFIAACGVVLEALFYRSFLDLAGTVTLPQQRLVVLGMLLGFSALLLVVGLAGSLETLRFGRNLEMRLRLLLFERIPLLRDRYFASRPVSDMAQRSHSVHQIRALPGLAARLLGHTFELILTTAGIAFLDPRSAPLGITIAVCAIVLPLVTQPMLSERDLRLRTHSGALCNSYFDALCGLMPIRAHGADSSMRSEHEGLLVNWIRAGYRLQRSVVFLDAIGLCAGAGMTIWLLIRHISRNPESGAGLLLVYWALNLPVIGRELAQTIWQYPQQRNLALRLLEPLDGTVAGQPASEEAKTDRSREGVEIVFEDVGVTALGQTILSGVNLCVKPGSQVCIVGPSGAGKSRLVGLLLGWHEPARGQIYVDGRRACDEEIERLRLQTAWVDPSIQRWNRSLLRNLRYGSTESVESPLIGQVIYASDLLPVLEALPNGLESSLGESGCLVSGGEGQRVRLGRAMLRPDARLVILDEPFSALDRRQRQKMLTRVKSMWTGATLIFITHDIGESLQFERVLLLENGAIVEDGSPMELRQKVNSRYRQLLNAEEDVRTRIWGDSRWRRIVLDGGSLREDVVSENNERRVAGKRLAG